MKSTQVPADSLSLFAFEKPGLLVSVRDSEEAIAALEGGADVIDVKEPARGSLGAADPGTVSEIIRVINRRAPVTAAFGELVQLSEFPLTGETDPNSNSISLFKIGLSQCGELENWRARWSAAIDRMTLRWSKSRAVAVVYADWQAAKAPWPHDVLDAAIDRQCPALLIDTWDKSTGTLFEHWPPGELRAFLDKVHSGKISIVLAGSLALADLPAAAELRPDIIAVRGAACIGGRGGTVSNKLVRQLKLALAGLNQPAMAKP